MKPVPSATLVVLPVPVLAMRKSISSPAVRGTVVPRFVHVVPVAATVQARVVSAALTRSVTTIVWPVPGVALSATYRLPAVHGMAIGACTADSVAFVAEATAAVNVLVVVYATVL